MTHPPNNDFHNPAPSSDAARKLLYETFGFNDFLPFQKGIINDILLGQDMLVVLPTGSGKSLCFQVPALLREGATIVISPLIALMKDQIDGLQQRGLPVGLIHSLLSQSEREQILEDIRNRRLKLIYISPERLRDGFFMNALLGYGGASYLWIIDEAHCITEWGHDFRTDYLNIPDAIELLGEGSQIVMFTATATPLVREDILQQMRRESAKVVCGDFDRPNLYLGCRQTPSKNEKFRTLAELMRKRGPGIIYTATRRQCEDVNMFLRELGRKSEYYHAGRSHSTRSEVQERFLANEIEIIVATNAFGMGVDKADIRFIIHYAHPGSIDAYYQEIGRGGRDGERCDCILLFSRFDRKVQEQFIYDATPTADSVDRYFSGLMREANRSGDISLNRKSYDDRNIELFEMEKAGLLNRRKAMCRTASIFLSREFERALEICTPFQREMLEALDNYADLGSKGYLEAVDLIEFRRKYFPDSNTFLLEQTLLQMGAVGVIAFRPIDRSVCYEMLAREIDESSWEKIDSSAMKRRAFKLGRLDVMIRYGGLQSCLRQYILDELGNVTSKPRCGFCDSCL